MNNENPSLQQNADGSNETHCNQATQNILKTFESYNNGSVGSAIINGNANDIGQILQNNTNPNYVKVDKNAAKEHANNGGISLISYINPEGHGHVLTFSVGANIEKGETANIGPKKYSGFVSLNTAISKKKEKGYYILAPNMLPSVNTTPNKTP